MKIQISNKALGILYLTACLRTNEAFKVRNIIGSGGGGGQKIITNNVHPKEEFVVNLNKMRGGDQITNVASSQEKGKREEVEDELSLEDHVHAAMRKLGLTVNNDNETNENVDLECKDGVCTIPNTTSSTDTTNTKRISSNSGEDIQTITKRLAKEMDVDESIVFAAIGATLDPIGLDDNNKKDDESSRINEDAAREMIQNEISAIQRVMEDCDEVS